MAPHILPKTATLQVETFKNKISGQRREQENQSALKCNSALKETKSQ